MGHPVTGVLKYRDLVLQVWSLKAHGKADSNIVICTVGFGTKNHYADEVQQQFTELDLTGKSMQL
jgi:hypothetical protein